MTGMLARLTIDYPDISGVRTIQEAVDLLEREINWRLPSEKQVNFRVDGITNTSAPPANAPMPGKDNTRLRFGFRETRISALLMVNIVCEVWACECHIGSNA